MTREEKHRVAAYVDDHFFKRIEQAMEKIGLKTKAEFVRVALKEKMDRCGYAPLYFVLFALPSVLPVLFNAELLLTVSALIVVAIVCFYAVRLVRAESPEEQARAQTVLAGVVIGGAIMVLAKPIAYWVTGIYYDTATGQWMIGGRPADLPPELITMIDRLLTLLMVIGVVVAIAGGIYAGIQLARKRRD